jgi:hypothetical protein
MDINDFRQRDWLRSMISDFYWFAVIMTICISFIMCCSSCSTPKPVVLERTLHDTVHVNNLRLDSIFQHDSIYFESIVKGDTVYRTKEITRWRDRVSIKRDTIYAVREKSVDIPVPQERTVPLWCRIIKYVGLLLVMLPAIFLISMIWLYHRKI